MPHLTTSAGIQWEYRMDQPDHSDDLATIVFLHGWGVDRRIWRQQVKYFSESFRVLTVDLPGHGKTSWQPMNLEGFARQFIELIERIEARPFTAVGSSLGGLFFLKVYSIHAALFDRFIFVGSMPKFAKSEEYPYGLDIRRIRKLGGQLETSYPSIVNVFFRSLFTKEERESRRYKWLQKFKQKDDVPMKPALASYLDILEAEDLRSVLKEVSQPIQFINGRDDEICCRDTVQYLRECCP
ncbi:MAG: alpha/beta fold hydrolase, partial [Candidatus Omnitrophica bacterium]|nr:alpha/beta fold hydrolase [Candidatus Omnitrophota bacterium]